MSDLPPDQNDTNDQGGLQGGWTAPKSPGQWRAPETPTEPDGWTVPVFPQDMQEEAVDTGAWHLPDPEDTTFTADDEIEIREETRPEDQLLEIAALVSDELPVETNDSDGPVAPEDLMYYMEVIDQEEEPENPQMSELLALASLMEEEQAPAADDSSITAVVMDDDEDDETDGDDPDEGLSPAERVILNQQPSPATSGTADPANYAAQALAQLGLDDNDDPLASVDLSNEALSGTGAAGTGTTDPASYAADQLAQLDGDETGMGMPTGPSTPIVEPEDPRQVELGRQFRETQEQVATLRNMVQNGQLSQDDYVNRLRDLMILDDDQNWWMMGVESDQWYKSENNAWVEAYPEPLAALGRYEQQQGGSGMGGTPGVPGADTQYAVNDSLPYINDQQVSPEERSDYTGAASSGIRLDDNFMPMPDPAPVDDFDATVAGPSAYADQLDYGQQTVPGDQYYEPTQQAQAFDYGTADVAADYGSMGGNTAAYTPDLATAPDYTRDAQGEIYADAVDEQRQRNTNRLIWAGVIVFVVIAASIGGFIFAATTWQSGIVNDFEPAIAGVFDVQQVTELPVTILDRDGNRIAQIEPEGDNRRPLDSLDEISNEALHAFLMLDDPDYFSQPGWTFTDVVNGYLANVTGGDIDPKTSPIVRQIVRERVSNNAATPPTRNEELVIAAEVTTRYDREEMLLLYLNEMLFFGNQIYGIEAAAQTYFEKSAAELNIAEAAFLAAIPQNPFENDPANNKETTISLMLVVLERMGNTGCIEIRSGEEFCVDRNMVSIDLEGDGQAAIPVAQVRVGDYSQEEESVGEYPHFTILVRDILQSVYGNDIFVGGYTVTTTLDAELQEEAQRLVREQVEALNGVNTGSAMITDPRTGEILALIGSPNFDDDEINGQTDFTREFRQSGDIIEPIIYAAAMRGVDVNGDGNLNFGEYYTPATVLWDVPIAYQENGRTIQLTNAPIRGDVTVRESLQWSLERPAVEAFRFVGTTAFQEIAERMGLRFVENEVGELTVGLTTALGETTVRLLDVVEAYGTIANSGQFVGLTAILQITDTNGVNVPLPEAPVPDQVLTPAVAYLMENILSDNATRAQQGSPFAGNGFMTIDNRSEVTATKSGTTRNAAGNAVRDLWTVGFTNNYVVGVWMGAFDGAEIRENFSGSVHSADLWQRIIRFAVERDQSLTQFQPPGNGTVIRSQICPLTGSVNGPCGQPLRNERFAQGRTPPDANVVGQGIITQATIDSWTQLLANQNCLQNQVTDVFVNINNSAAIEWINTTQAGQNYARLLQLNVPVQSVPAQACDINTTTPTVNVTSPVPNEPVQGEAYAIIGQVTADNFARYEFLYAPVNTENFVPVPGLTSITQQQPPNSNLATWNTTLIENGQYTLRLAVFSTTGGFLYRDVPIQINNPIPTPTPIPTQAPTLVPTVPPAVDPIPFDPIPGAGTGDNSANPPVVAPTDIPASNQVAPTDGPPSNPLDP